MPYLVQFRRDTDQEYLTIITQSFACKKAELPRELLTTTRAKAILKIETYTTYQGAKANLDHIWISSTGRYVEIPEDKFDDPGFP